MRLLIALALLLPGAPVVAAEPVPAVVSAGPEAVGVTFYRDPNRAAGQAPNRRWLNGFALITERRTISIPAGISDIRFEGVAGGIQLESAIVAGLPQTVEKNQDAYLLSPASLLDRALGQRVTLRRTLPDGVVREEEAIVRSDAAGAVVLRTAAGEEALRCTGLNETILYDGVPPGLAARPTLSVRVSSAAPVIADITLSYLAAGFDWEANYVAELDESGREMRLFAWLTLASADETSFGDADTQAVAGRLNRARGGMAIGAERPPLRLACWPSGTTSDVPPVRDGRFPPPPPPPPAPPPPPMMAAESITVTGSRMARMADEEILGDLRLYRLPDRVTVAANAQKQVAFLSRERVRGESLHRQRFYAADPTQAGPLERLFRTRNRAEDGLGVALPAGRAVLFTERGGRPLLIGESEIGDRTLNERVEFAFPAAPGLNVETARNGPDAFRITLRSDRATPTVYEAELDSGGRAVKGRGLTRRDGLWLWRVTVPANASVSLEYRVEE